MKKILVSLLTAGLISSSFITACGSNVPGNEVDEENTEASAGDDEAEDSDNEGNKDNIFSGKKKSSDMDEPDTETENDSDPGDDDIKSEAWQQAYLDYLDENPPEDGGFSYALIYVDDDDIPEMVADTGYEAGGCQIVTWHNGMTDVLQTARLYFTYIEKKNLLNNCDGHMGYYYDSIYSIEDGKWTLVFDGEYSGFDENGGDDYNEETGRYRCTDYYVDGKETDEEGYYKALKKAYDFSSEKDVTSYIPYDELLVYLDTGKLPYEDHRYELFVRDCTWDEARADCEKRGGYLACMTTDEEFDTVENLIRQEDKTNICFYVGGMRDENYSWIWIEPGLSSDSNSCLGYGYYKHWLNGGPSYSDTLSDGTEIDETCVELIYRKSDDKFYLNDVTNDVPGVYPSFKGKIGYICEFAD